MNKITKKFLNIKKKIKDFLLIHLYAKKIIYSLKFQRDIITQYAFISNLFSNFFYPKIYKKKFDCVIAHDYHTLNLALLLKEKKKVKKIIFDLVEYPIHYERSYYARRSVVKNGLYQSDLLYKLIKSQLLKTDYIIFGNHKYREMFSNLKIKNSIIYNSNNKNFKIKFNKKKTDQKKYIIGVPNSFTITEKPRDFFYKLKTLTKEIDKDIFLYFIGNSFNEIQKKEIFNLANEYSFSKKKILIFEKMDYSKYINFLSQVDVVYFYNNPNYGNLKYLFSNRLFDSITARVPILVNDDCEVGKFVNEYKIGGTFRESDTKTFIQAFKKCVIIKKHNDYLIRINNIVKKYDFQSQCKKAFSKIKKNSKIVLLCAKKINNRNQKFINYLKKIKKCKVTILSEDNDDNIDKKEYIIKKYINTLSIEKIKKYF